MYFRGASTLVLCSLIASAAFVGCGRDPLMREGFCDRWGQAACTPEVVSVCQNSTAQCQTSQSASCRDWLPEDFQDVGVDDCLEAVREAYADADLSAAELDVVWRLSGPCSNIVVPAESGEACVRDEDCHRSVGLTCVLKDQATGTCERAEPVGAGFSCVEPEQACEPGFYCNGENCIVAADTGETCSNDSQCAVGLFCLDGVCAEQLPGGADCTSDRECDSRICYEVDVDQRVCVDRIRLSPAEPACDALR